MSCPVGRASCVSGAGSRPQQSLGGEAGSEAVGRLGHGGPGPPEKRGHVENRREKTWESGKQRPFSPQSPRRRPRGWRHGLWFVAWRTYSVDVDLVPPGAGPTQALPGAGAGPSLCARSRLLGPLPRPSFWPSAHRHGSPLISGPVSPTPLLGAHPEFSLKPGPPFPSHSTVLLIPELCLALCICIRHLYSWLSYTHPSIHASSHHLFSFFKVILPRYD